MGSMREMTVAVGLLASGASADVISFAAQRPAYPAVDSIEAIRDGLTISADRHITAPFETQSFAVAPMVSPAAEPVSELAQVESGPVNATDSTIESDSPMFAPAFDFWLGLPTGLSAMAF